MKMPAKSLATSLIGPQEKPFASRSGRGVSTSEANGGGEQDDVAQRRSAARSSTPRIAKPMPGFQTRAHQDRRDDDADQREVDAADDAERRVRRRVRRGRSSSLRIESAGRGRRTRPARMPPTNSVSRKQVRRRPEEVDAAQEAEEQRRIAERRQRAADVRDQEDEEHDDVDVVAAVVVGAQQRADHHHRGAGRADQARQHRADQRAGRVLVSRRAVQVAA